MKQMMLALETRSSHGAPCFDLVDAVLSETGFSAETEDDGGVMLMPAATYLGHFEEETSASTLAEILRLELAAREVEILSLAIVEVGTDRVLMGSRISPEHSLAM